MLIPIVLMAAAVPQAAELAVVAPEPSERGTLAFPAGFFAETQPTSAYDMVIRVPGFTFDKGASVRGLSGAGGNVLIDGQPPVSKGDGLDEILKRIPASSVERLDLIRGGAPGVDMDGRSVLLNVVRKQSAGFRAAVTPSTSLVYDGRVANSLRAEAQWRWPGGRSAELSQVLSTGAFDEQGDGARTRFNADGTIRLRSRIDADATRQIFSTTAAYEAPWFGGRARVNAAITVNPFSSELYDRYVGGGREYEYNNFKREQQEVGGRYSRALSQRLGLEVVGLRQNTRTVSSVHFEAPSLERDFRLERNGEETVGRVTLKLQPSTRLSFEVSAEGALNRLDSETDLVVNRLASIIPAANVQIKETRGEAAVRATWQANGAVTIEAGLRQERSKTTAKGDVTVENPLNFMKPRVALTWIASANDQVRLRIEREVGQLNFEDFVASSNVASTGTLSAGNPDLTPQQAWVVEATYERRFKGAGALVVAARHFAFSDVVDRVPVFSTAGVILADSPGNIGNGTRDELQASFTLPLDPFGVSAAQLRGQLTRRWSEVIDPVTGMKREISPLRTSGGRDAASFAPVSWDAHFTQDLPRLNAVWGFDVVGGVRDRAFRLTEIESKKVSTAVSVFTEYRPRSNLTLRVEAQALNQRNVKRVRAVYAGARNLGVLDYTDVRSLEWGGSLFFSLRRSFGG